MKKLFLQLSAWDDLSTKNYIIPSKVITKTPRTSIIKRYSIVSMHLSFYFHHHFFISHAKHISWECKYNFDVKKCDSNQIWNNNKCWPDSKNPKEHRCTKKYYTWNPATCSCGNDKYLESIIDNSVITCDVKSVNKCYEYYVNKCCEYCVYKFL